MNRSLTLHAALFFALSSTPAWAEDKSTLSTARELAKLGLMDYDAGNFQAAADRLAKAYQVVRVPTLAVHQARALVKLGRWVAASELYLEALNIPPEKSWQSIQLDAQRDAVKEREALLLRIPRVRIAILGATLGEVEASMDDTAIPTALLDSEQLVDPGTRRISARRGDQVATETVTVKEASRLTVTLRFGAKTASLASGATAPNPPQSAKALLPAAAPPVSASTTSKRGRAQRTVGWVGIGIGSAGLMAGTVAGVIALSKRSALRASGDCSPDLRHCDEDPPDTVNAYNALRTVSTIGLYAGGALAVAGVTLLLTAPKQGSEQPVGLWLGPSGAALTGGF